MRKASSLILIFIITATAVRAQKIDSIYFNLYTDSLKKGFYNYINIDGKTADGKWIPLTAKEIILTSTGGKFDVNDLFIDSTFSADSVKIRAALKDNPAVWKEVTIYIRKRGFTELLKTDEEVINEIKQKAKSKKKGSGNEE